MSSSPEKKKKKKKKSSQIRSPTPQSTPNPSLPDDLLLSCFARVSRLYYPTLSLVSKSFRSLLASPELYKTRNLLNRTESSLYVCLQLTHHSNPSWFTLCRKPDRTLTNHSSGYALATLPIPHSPFAHSSGLVALGSSIYNIGQSSVSILDCRYHTWNEAPSMRVERNYAVANVLNGKIYVAGGCDDRDSSNWMEVFDPNTQTWEPVLNPLVAGRYNLSSAVVKGKIYMFGRRGVAYEPEEGIWKEVEDFNLVLGSKPYCVIENVLYDFNDDGNDGSRGIRWYDFKTMYWRKVKGLPKFRDFGCVELANYGGKMAVFWDAYEQPFSDYPNKKFCCAVIALERRNGEEMWGNVEWFDDVLTVPDSYQFVCALTATV